MLIALKLCAIVLMLVTGAGAQVDSFPDITVYPLDTGRSVYIISGSASVRTHYNNVPSTTFIMEYQEVPFVTEENICTMMPLVLADSTVREIVTPNFGNAPYFDDEACQVTIQSNVTDASEVRVEVTHHDMECPHDSITICDVSDLSDWTPWVSKGCCEYRDCGKFVRDTRRRQCLTDNCVQDTVQERTRVCSRKCGDCLLP
ncbi:uncharacterized protein [Haliotis asinina]|uniref:uncharacterized protein n=1 Tax=Haliotis asinina TaxID=109174 RepID=UPI0035318D27